MRCAGRLDSRRDLWSRCCKEAALEGSSAIAGYTSRSDVAQTGRSSGELRCKAEAGEAQETKGHGEVERSRVMSRMRWRELS